MVMKKKYLAWAALISLAVVSSLLITGCSTGYEAGIPEFTTEKDRSSDFQPGNSSASGPAEKENVSRKISEGASSVEQGVANFKATADADAIDEQLDEKSQDAEAFRKSMSE